MSEETPDSEEVQSVASTATFGAGFGDLATYLMWASVRNHTQSLLRVGSYLKLCCLEDSWSGDCLGLERKQATFVDL